MKYRQTFTVRGFGGFPFDMLRYDHCWPASESDSSELTERFSPLVERTVKLVRFVELKNTKPTVARWESFSWRVLDSTIETRKI
jgi:hypothetical protein